MTGEKSNQKKAKEAGQTAARYEKLDRKGHVGTGTTSYGERAKDKRHAQGIYRHLAREEGAKKS